MCPRTSRASFSAKCPDCGARMVKGHKGWRVCPNGKCSLIRARGHQRGRPEKVERAAEPRLMPLSGEEIRILLEPYLTPGVEGLLDK